MTIEIQPFREEWAEEVIALILSIQRDEFGFPITADDQPDLKEIASFYQSGSGNFWVALAAGRVVGTISLKDIGNSQAALRKMFVAREFRGRELSVAARLLATLFDWSRARGIKEIYLGTTEKFLAAHRFYEKSGFQLVAESALPAAFPLMGVDTRFYKYVLA